MKVFGLDIRVRKAGKRAYEAADKGRRAKAFRLANSTGANLELSGALVTLRDRSRHMVRNNGWSKRAVEAIVKHTVGEGIQPAPKGGVARTKRIKEIWSDWAGSTACDWEGKTTFYGLQELAMRAIVEGGDVLILRRWIIPDANDDCRVPLKLQILEGDHLDHYRNGPNEYGYARLGIQYDHQKRRIGCWIFEAHPSDGMPFGSPIESHFVPNSDIIHAYEILRPGQVRGLPFGVASFMKASDFSDYEDAQLVKQKIAACLAAFVIGSDDMGTEPVERLEPGIIEHLSSGEHVEFSNPPTVADYDAYSGRILQGVAASWGITYEMLTMDYSKVNFTSGRMAKIDVTQNFRSWQYNMMVPQVCASVWKWFNDACMAAGLINNKTKADWTAPRIQQLDPAREIQAQIAAIKGGLATLSETIRENGREPEEFFEEYAQDIQTLLNKGINIESIITQLLTQEKKPHA